MSSGLDDILKVPPDEVLRAGNSITDTGVGCYAASLSFQYYSKAYRFINSEF